VAAPPIKNPPFLLLANAQILKKKFAMPVSKLGPSRIS
jgi:hypothetical protein